MKQTFEFLCRFPEWLASDQTLLILDEDAEGLVNLAGNFDVMALHQHNHEHAKQLGRTSYFSFDIRQTYQRIIIDWPKAKRLGELLVAFAGSLLAPDGELLVIGSNKGGIKSVAKRLKESELSADKLESANHCSLLRIDGTHGEFNLDDWWQSWSIDSLRISTLPGVFSANKLDKGTSLLLASLPTLAGDVMDFGCGCGVIGLSVAKQSPDANLTLVDNSLMAVLSARRNAEQNELSNITIVARNGLRNHPKARFRHIVTNPPFHEGLRTNIDMSKAFLSDMAKLMHLKGQLWAVANEFLAYEETLNHYFKMVKPIARESGFKILHAQAPYIQK
ncbi:class I SAM-dependent methyltransferase [Salinibius halmophilus]|uniref:class I SAM-dependent methyltransferase n=1 Tax=Salinibius halmophilus TaxID=1853216 RepID=UPI000E671152|nr:class I SAM-dependent methyltransferase [Salinibius halmophilus]